jgi:signal transduction histidine kinase
MSQTQWLAPSETELVEHNALARDILRVLLLVLNSGLAFLILITLSERNRLGLAALLTGVAGNTISLLLLRLNYVRRATQVMVLGIWLMVTLIAITRLGIFTPSINAYAALITVAAFLLSEFQTIALTVGIVSTILVMAWAQSRNLLILLQEMPTLSTTILSHATIIALVLTTALMIARRIKRMVLALHASQQQQIELRLAQEKNTFMTEFITNISHDLKTPLTVINTSLYMIERLNDPERQREKIQHIYDQTRLVEKFIQDILLVARLEHSPDLEMAAVDVNAILLDIRQQLHPHAESRQIRLIMQLEQSLPVARGDSHQLLRAFMNLVENAIHYTPEAGAVTISTRVEKQHIIIDIADTGIGIAPADIPHIFERFYRADTARKFSETGTGLGLAIVQKIIDRHGGSIQVQSIPNQGTTFCVRLTLTETT